MVLKAFASVAGRGPGPPGLEFFKLFKLLNWSNTLTPPSSWRWEFGPSLHGLQQVLMNSLRSGWARRLQFHIRDFEPK